MKDFTTVCFIRNRKQPDEYYLRIDNEPAAIVKRLKDQFEYDVELSLTFKIDNETAKSIGYWSSKDAAEWFIVFLKERVATGQTEEPFLHNWYEFKDLDKSVVISAFDVFESEKKEYLEQNRIDELVGKQENLFA